MAENRANFGSKLGAILASAGSAIGLGNIWRFPYETGENGGAAFILIYLVCVVLLGMPVMISEFLIGRHSRSNTAGAYRLLAPHSPWQWIGFLGVFTGFIILSYYAVVAGWTLEYTVQAGIGNLGGKTPEQFTADFNEFASDPFRPLVWLIVFLGITHWIIVRGVKKGIERSAKVLMPLLFLLIIVLSICSLSLPNASKGVEFLLRPDFSAINSSVFLSAMGQAFFSLSLGMGCLCTYASYFSDSTNLTKTAFSVGLIDTLVAILAGFIIFPAAFSVGISPDSGPSLIFITLPNVFVQAFQGTPVLAYICSLMFYILLALAALTSAISMHEVVTAYVHEEFHISRAAGARWVTGSCMVLGILCSLSLGVLSDYTVLGLSIFDLFDYLSAKVLLPLGGMLIALFTGWRLSKRVVWKEVTNNGSIRIHIFRAYFFLLKFIVPVLIALVFVNELGLL